jgi:uncharacterized protein (DUF2336 family)
MQTEYYEHLREIASADKIPESGDLVEALGRACLAPDTTLGRTETALLGDILQQLVRDVEMPVRRALAGQLSARDDAPHDLILLLANDVVDVAYPLLAKSPMLCDQDLIDVVARHARQHALAVAKRATISESVSDALVETGDSNVVVTLLENDGAMISSETMDGLVADSKNVEAYRTPLLGRKDLDLDIAMRMADWVGDSLRQYISDRFNIDHRNLERAVSDAVLEAIDDDIFESNGNGAMLDIEGEVPGPRLLHALTHDNLTLFKQTFEELCGVRSSWAEDSLYCSGEALAIACRAIGLEGDVFARILCHLHSNDIFSEFQESKFCIRMTQYFDSIEKPNAAKVLEGWRRAPG